MPSGPDFICIGMQKAGTGWLHDQVQYHPDFWMPPVKEIYYFVRNPPRLKNVTELLEKARNQPKAFERRFKRWRRWDTRDYEFLEEAAALSGQPVNFEAYASLFRFKGSLLSGDITPGYGELEPEVIKRIAAHFPAARVVLLIRDPVSRAWSQICMSARKEKFNANLLEDVAAFAEYLKGAQKIHRFAFPAAIAERWSTHAPDMRFQHFFFDDIVEQPAETRRQILEFIGADPKKSSGEIPPDHNKKSEAAKMLLTNDIAAVLADFFADEIRTCAKRFGSHAVNWAEKYGIAL